MKLSTDFKAGPSVIFPQNASEASLANSRGKGAIGTKLCRMGKAQTGTRRHRGHTALGGL